MKKFILLLSIILIGCGSRKTETSISDKEKENDISTKSDINLNYKFDKVGLEPMNLDRPMLINGKEYYNTKIIHHYEEGEKTEKTEIEDKSKESDFQKDRKTERDNTKLFITIAVVGILGMFMFLFVVLLVLIWWVNSKFNAIKSVIPN